MCRNIYEMQLVNIKEGHNNKAVCLLTTAPGKELAGMVYWREPSCISLEFHSVILFFG